MEVPTGWVQVLRGPRRPSQKWPMAQPVQRPRQPRVSPVPTGPRAPIALAVMGDTDAVAVECLKAELEKAKKACQRPPLDVEVDECRKFIVRSEKRIAELDRERESEQSALTNAKARLHRLETEQSVPVEEAPAPADWKAQMEALQAQVNSLREERNQAVHSPAVKRQAVGHVPSRVSEVTQPMPTLVPAELDNWMQDLQVELQSAMNWGDQRRVVEVSTKLAEGASQMVYLTGGMAT